MFTKTRLRKSAPEEVHTMTTEQCVSDTDSTRQAAMPIHTQTLHDLVAAMWSVDTSDGPLDLDAVARIRQHQFDD
jgi:hypothetical protein